MDTLKGAALIAIFIAILATFLATFAMWVGMGDNVACSSRTY
jgi:hypothetical protein